MIYVLSRFECFKMYQKSKFYLLEIKTTDPT